MTANDDIWVELTARRYPVRTESGDAEALCSHVNALAPRGKIFLLSDSNVWPLHAEHVQRALEALGRVVLPLQVPAGEASKSIETMSRLWSECLAAEVERTDVVVAVGGGVVGDIGGFLASTLLRGIGLVQVPTSVLAMSDAAIGGKTGVNTSAGKNLVGTFYQPFAVIQWTGALVTLPEREVRGGLAEVVKSALIAGESELAELERRSASIAAGDLEALTWAVRMAAALKAEVVAADEREGGRRRLLNLGHTFGHAIEHASGYGSWSHGEAVSAGMMMALQYGQVIGINDEKLVSRVRAILVGQKLPVAPPSLTMAEWSSPLRVDKKREGETVKLILCKRPGDCQVLPTPLTDVVEWIRQLC